LNVSEVSFALEKAGKNSFGKRNSTGISNISNAAVEKLEYHALTPDQKNTLRLKCLKRCHVRKGHTGNGNINGKNSGKGATLKSLTRSIAALITKIDKFSFPDDDDDEDEYSDKGEGTSNRSNAALNSQSKKKKYGNN
jgi:hypothetical protein